MAFSAKESLQCGWKTFRERPWVLIGGVALAFLVSAVVSTAFDPGDNPTLATGTFLMGAASFVVGLFVEIGLVTFVLRAHDDVGAVSIRDLWNPTPFWRYLAGQLLLGIIVIGGLILLVVLGVIAALGLVFTSYLIVDKGKGPLEALKESWRITKGHKKQIALLMLALVGINIVGVLLLFVGLIITVPLSMLAMAHAYRTLEHGASELVPAGA